jgi:phosphate/sulfate permease
MILSSNQQLFLLGSLAISVGILTYSRRVMETVGSNIIELSAEAALVVVLAESLVLFIFSSSGLSNFFVKLGLPPIPLAPVSSSQVVVGCVIGIGLYKGARNINVKILGEIGLGWISTPLMSGVLAFFMLFFMKNIFNIDVGHKLTDTEAITGHIIATGQDFSSVIKYTLAGITGTGIVAMIYYYLLERRKAKELSRKEEKFWKYLK